MRMRIRSRVVRIRGKRARIRAIVRVTASSTHAEAHYSGVATGQTIV